MKKFGFTLVEVLMTLGIIGVVGMLVTPSLMQNGRNETNAARLSTAVSNFENGIQTGMAADNAEDLYHWDSWTNDGDENVFYGNITRFMALSGHDEPATIGGLYTAAESDVPFNMNNTGGKDNNNQAAFNGDRPYTALTTKNGTIYFIANKANAATNGESNEATARANGRTLYSKAADVIIDVNGTTRPNIVGRDIFVFMLSNEGTLFPYGSQETSAYVPAPNPTIPQWNAINNANGGCSDNNGNLPEALDPRTCTARVVESGYRIDY